MDGPPEMCRKFISRVCDCEREILVAKNSRVGENFFPFFNIP